MIWSLMEHDYSLIFNTGLMVIQPNLATFKGLVDGIKGYQRPDVFWYDASCNPTASWTCVRLCIMQHTLCTYHGCLIQPAFSDIHKHSVCCIYKTI